MAGPPHEPAGSRRFTPNGTKTRIAVDLFVPRALIQPLEEYLELYRPLLVNGNDPGALFLTPRSKPMRSDQVARAPARWKPGLISVRPTTDPSSE